MQINQYATSKAMDAKTFTLAGADEVHKFFGKYRPHAMSGWWFRGQADTEWELLPKAGRQPFLLPDDQHLDRFNHWAKQAIAYLPAFPANEWERLAIAQHYGLATCLLDWTFNPLVALYFACSASVSANGVVYCYDPVSVINEETVSFRGSVIRGMGFAPRAISPRILNQRAAFTVHLPPNRSVSIQESSLMRGEPSLVRLVVPSKYKAELLTLLDDYGVNRVTLFPDLEGLSAHVNWETERLGAIGV